MYRTNNAAGLGRLLPSDVVYKGDNELKAIAEVNVLIHFFNISIQYKCME